MSNDRNDYRGNPLDLIETLADVAGGLGDWIANGTPDSGSIAGEIQQRYRDHCDAWSNNPSWVQQIDPGARLFLSNACANWLDSQGSGDPVTTPPPFEGGQCAGVEYEVTFQRNSFTVISCSSGTPQTFNVNQQAVSRLFGPLSGGELVANGEGNCGTSRFTATLNGFDSQGNPDSVVLWDVNRAITTRISSISGSITSVVRVDGQPDNCGNLPGETGPNPNPRPDPGLDPEDEPFERIPGRPVLPMPRITDPFGEPVQLPNFPLPNVEGPSLYPGDDIPGGEPTEPGDKGDPDPPTETTPGGEEENTDSSRWLMGILVEVTDAPGRAPGFQTQAGFVYTEAGFVYQGAGDELEYYEESERLLSGGQYFPAVKGYDTWRVVANPFYRLKVTPFYKEKD